MLTGKITKTLPEPLRAAEIPSFTHTSVVVRLPEIGWRTLADNDFDPQTVDRVQALIGGIPHEEIRPVAGVPAEYGWDTYVRPYLGQNWLEIPWFFAEEYFYLRLLEATGYFEPGSAHRRDPYAVQKRLGLETTRESIAILAQQVENALSHPGAGGRDSLRRLILADLWGNQNDLSMWPVEQSGKNGRLTGGSASAPSAEAAHKTGPGDNGSGLKAALAHLLADDSALVLEALEQLAQSRPRIDILLDNAGYELVADLALTAYLLGAGIASQVVLHAKSYPVFVSDALTGDIHATLDWLCFSASPAARSLGILLRQHLVSGGLRLSHHPFWTSPLPAWEMPSDLAADIAGSSLFISKGDANYRRLLGDRHWPFSTPFAAVVDYFEPAVMALRTCKSEIAAGIPAEKIPTGDETWIYNGRWGLIQFAPGRNQ